MMATEILCGRRSTVRAAAAFPRGTVVRIVDLGPSPRAVAASPSDPGPLFIAISHARRPGHLATVSSGPAFVPGDMAGYGAEVFLADGGGVSSAGVRVVGSVISGGWIFDGSIQPAAIDAATRDLRTCTAWFNTPVLKSTTTAPTPGTPDAEAMGHHGAVQIPIDLRIGVIHLHQIHDGSTGSNDAEVYRYRDGVMTLIATVSVAAGGGDFGSHDFAMESEALRSVEQHDYLYMQATSVMGAAGRPAGFVDVHFSPA